MTIKVGLPLAVPGEALAGVGELARAIEEAGLDSVSYSELSSDPLLHLTVAAGTTSRVDLVTNIVVAFARSPMTLAVQARAIQEYSNGRLILGLGSQIKPHIERRFSMPWSSPAARMAEYIEALRAIWSSWRTGERLNFRGEFYTHTLMTPMFTPVGTQPPPKVFLAAVGDLMTSTAGRVADGLLLHAFTTSRYLREVTVPALGRTREGFEISAVPFVVTGRDDAELADSARRVREQLAFYGSTPAYRGVLALHGWGELADDLNALSRGSAPERWQRMGELITDDVLAEFAVVGAPDTIGPQLQRQFGDVVTRCELNTVGVPDAAFALELAKSVHDTLA